MLEKYINGNVLDNKIYANIRVILGYKKARVSFKVTGAHMGRNVK